MSFMSLDMICISKRGINFHPSISIKANGITSHYSRQPRTVKKDNPFGSNIFKVYTQSKIIIYYNLLSLVSLPFQIFFQPDWQIDVDFLNRAIMARAQIWVHRWRAQNKDFGAIS